MFYIFTFLLAFITAAPEVEPDLIHHHTSQEESRVYG